MPPTARGLRARSVVLAPGQVMAWHSTQRREELLIALKGALHVEAQNAPDQRRRIRLTAGQCAFLPRQTMHCVVNDSKTTAHYVYVTAPIR